MAAQAPTDGLAKLSVKEEAANGKAATASAANGATNGGAAADHEDDDSEDEAENNAPEAAGTGAAKKKKKRKPKKKKKAGAATQQSDPPRVLISQLFPNDSYPKGEEVEYVDENRYRTTSEEKRHLDNLNPQFLVDYRHGAETHRQVRQWAQKNIKPGQTLTEIANGIEDSVRALVGHDGLSEGDALVAGMGFPTGLNLNHIAAHYSPNAGNKMVLAQDDVMKVDIGVHVNGRIVDSAFTMAFNPKYQNLLDAVKAATNTGVKEAGIDARLGEIGEAIQETMESYEIELNGETFRIDLIGKIGRAHV